jgi:uncharacterized membrane protein
MFFQGAVTRFRIFRAYRMRAAAIAVWCWWIGLGAWRFPGNPAVLSGFSVMALAGCLTLALSSARGKSWLPDDPAERFLIALTPLLAINAFAWQLLDLSPRLSFLTALPLIWTSAYISAALAARTALARSAFARLDARRIPAVLLFLAAFNAWIWTGAFLRIAAMSVDYWDLGSIGQAMANLARGRGFVSTDPAGFSDLRFAQHFEPVFALLSPVMLWSRGAEAMMALQALAVSIAAVFTGLAMERILARRMAFWIGLAGICLHPAAGFPLWNDFHGDVFALLPLSILLWAMAAERRRTFWIAFAAAACCIEYSLLASFGIALMLLHAARKGGDIDAERRRTRMRQSLLLAGLSAVAFAAGVFLVMPMFRSPGAASVLASHLAGLPPKDGWGLGPGFLAPMFAQATNKFNLANLIQAIAPFSAFMLLSPAAWLGALPHLAKDLAFGLDIGNHHFAPAIPAMFAGLAFGIRAKVPEAGRTRALAQAGACIALAGALWGPMGKSGWDRMAAWWRMLPEASGKSARLKASLPHDRNRFVTGGLGGLLFDAPRLGFLGSIKLPHAPDLGDADIVLELWDQGFTDWAPLDRMQDQLAEALAGNPDPVWLPAASGTLRLERGKGEGREGAAGGNAFRTIGIDSAWAGTDTRRATAREASGADATEMPSTAAMGSGRMGIAWRALAGDSIPDPARSHAVVAVRGDGNVLPLGLRSAGRGWTWFPVRAELRPGEGLRVQWRETDRLPGDTGPIRAWTVKAEIRVGADSI